MTEYWEDRALRFLGRDGPILLPLVFVALGYGVARFAGRPSVIAFIVVAIVGAAAVTYAWRHPVAILIVVVVGLPFQQLVQGWLYRRGVPVSPLTFAGYWKEVLLAVVVTRAFKDRPKRSPAVIEQIAFCILVLVALYVILPIGPDLRVRYVAARADAAFILVFLSVRWLPSTDQERNRAERAVLFGGMVVAAFGLWNYFNPDGWTDWVRNVGLLAYRHDVVGDQTSLAVVRNAFGSTEVVRAGSIFLSPITLAYVLLIPLSVVASRMARRVATRLELLAGAVCLAGLLVTFTRSAIALIPVIGVITAASSGRLSRGVGIVVAMSVLLVVMAGFVGAGEQVSSGFDAKDQRTSAHITALGESVNRVLTRPGGSGLGTGAEIAARFEVSGRLENSENFYLLFGTEVGLLGTVLAGAFAIAAVRTFLAAARAGGGLAIGAAAGMTALAIGALVLDTFQDEPAMWALMLIAGMALYRLDELRGAAAAQPADPAVTPARASPLATPGR